MKPRRPVKVVRQRGVSLDAGVVIEEVAYGDTASLRREVGKIGLEWRVEGETPALLQHHDGSCRELLSQRPDPEHGVGRDRNFPLDIREAITPAMEKRSIAQYCHGSAWL